MGDPEWTKDAKFTTFMGRKANEDALDGLLAEWTKDYNDREAVAIL